MAKKIAIIGSTGSIGTQTLEVVRNNSDLRVVCLAAGKNVTLMEQQVREFHPLLAVLFDEKAAEELKTRIAFTSVTITARGKTVFARRGLFLFLSFTPIR